MIENVSAPGREIVLGRNSKVWRALATDTEFAARFVAIGHADFASYAFTPRDRVWVLAYSHDHDENVALLRRLQAAGIREVVYFSSASTIVNRLTGCYGYPRVKLAAEQEAARLLQACIVILGLVYQNEDELPGGLNAATSHAQLRAFMLEPRCSDREVRLFRMVAGKFRSEAERRLYLIYGGAQWLVRRWPCVLRPLDFLLRALGFRWYGYLHLSNRLWTTTKLS